MFYRKMFFFDLKEIHLHLLQNLFTVSDLRITYVHFNISSMVRNRYITLHYNYIPVSELPGPIFCDV